MDDHWSIPNVVFSDEVEALLGSGFPGRFGDPEYDATKVDEDVKEFYAQVARSYESPSNSLEDMNDLIVMITSIVACAIHARDERADCKDAKWKFSAVGIHSLMMARKHCLDQLKCRGREWRDADAWQLDYFRAEFKKGTRALCGELARLRKDDADRLVAIGRENDVKFMKSPKMTTFAKIAADIVADGACQDGTEMAWKKFLLWFKREVKARHRPSPPDKIALFEASAFLRNLLDDPARKTFAKSMLRADVVQKTLREWQTQGSPSMKETIRSFSST